MGETDERVGIERVDFVSAPTRDLEGAVHFYGQVLGLPVSIHRPEQGYAEVETGNVTINLFDPESMGLEFSPNRHLVALGVTDVERARRRLEGAGVEFEGETEDTGVCLIARFRDPDGNGLLLHRRYVPVTDREQTD
ncbi:MAG: glyoxalase/bleomycin resistance/dioxygenase family protein [Solirubrobacterales bacterium]|nr:glyoxalase/bleomycin resistance/dioxygenase family protein [Solirubrobacterales bacterium]